MKGAINMAFLAYKANECFNHQYIKIPKDLFINPLYKHLNSDSKIIYGFLLDRLSLSIKNNWIDEKTSNVYLIFARKKIQELLHLSDKTVTKAFKELKACELIYEKRQQCSKPNIIYIGKINPYFGNSAQSRKNYDSGHGNSTTPESENLRPNKTNNNKTNIDNNFNFKNFDNRFRDTTGQYENLDRFLVNANDFIKNEGGL